MADLKIDARREGAIGLVRLSGEARLELIDGLKAAVRRLRTEGAKCVLLSLKDMTFVDSASVGAVLELDKEISAGSGSLVLCAIPVRVAKMLDAMGLSGRLKIAANEAAGRKACGPA